MRAIKGTGAPQFALRLRKSKPRFFLRIEIVNIYENFMYHKPTRVHYLTKFCIAYAQTVNLNLKPLGDLLKNDQKCKFTAIFIKRSGQISE